MGKFGIPKKRYEIPKKGEKKGNSQKSYEIPNKEGKNWNL